MMRMNLIASHAAIVLALALGGCGSKSADDAAGSSAGGETASAEVASSIDPCSLLTAAEVQAITTDAVTPQRRDDTCVYQSKPDDGLQIQLFATEGEKQMRAVRNASSLLGGIGEEVAGKGGAGADAAAMLKPDGTAVPKLGDDAAWSMNSTLAVRKGDAVIMVTPPIIHDPANHPGYPLVKTEEKRAIAIKAATQALGRLPS